MNYKYNSIGIIWGGGVSGVSTVQTFVLEWGIPACRDYCILQVPLGRGLGQYGALDTGTSHVHRLHLLAKNKDGCSLQLSPHYRAAATLTVAEPPREKLYPLMPEVLLAQLQ